MKLGIRENDSPTRFCCVCRMCQQALGCMNAGGTTAIPAEILTN